MSHTLSVRPSFRAYPLLRDPLAGLPWDVRQRDIRIAALLGKHSAHQNPHLAAFVDCFNSGLYYEAHEVLEELWLGSTGPNYSIYKGLIQLAGAFVHVQKARPEPAVALLELARANLATHPATHEGVEVGPLLQWLEAALRKVRAGSEGNGCSALDLSPPRIEALRRL